MNISKRLSTIASFITKDAFVIDVGADHGLLEKYLIDNQITEKIIAVENKKGPFNILKDNLIGYDIELSYSNGIEKITNNVDTIVIAGMGGSLICSILEHDKEKLGNVKSIVVDAHTDIEMVRRNICKFGYHIDEEKIVYENKKYYFVIKFEKGIKKHTDIEYEFGVGVALDSLFSQYKNDQLIKLKRIEKFNSKSKEKIGRLESL